MTKRKLKVDVEDNSVIISGLTKSELEYFEKYKKKGIYVKQIEDICVFYTNKDLNFLSPETEEETYESSSNFSSHDMYR
jgi:hypothetical protein